MAFVKVPDAEPIPGYRLVAKIGQGGCGEVWQCEVSGGLPKAIKFVYGNLRHLNSRHAVEEECRAIERIKTIRHPFLLSVERVELIDGELAIVTELADLNLHQLREQFARGGRPGIPRPQLINYLLEAAEVLDLLYRRYGLQHLDVKPRNLFLVYNHVKVGDFGLVQSLSAGGVSTEMNIQIGAITPVYAAPELFQGAISPFCDQYSLAITYQELLTGVLPFRGRTARELLIQHCQESPDLSPLPLADRSIVEKALAKDPEERFESCTEFVEALRSAGASPLVSNPRRFTESVNESEHIPTCEIPKPEVSCPETDTFDDVAVTAPHDLGDDRSHHAKFVGGYELVRQIRATPISEYWEATAPEGKNCLLKFLYGFTARGEELEMLVARLRSLQYPLLPPIRIAECRPGKIAIVTPWCDHDLRQEWRRHRRMKLPGIPRIELIDFLRPVAEGLDYLFRQHSLQHLNLQPRLIWNQRGQVLLDEFGYYELLWHDNAEALRRRARQYVAPELARGSASSRCDQYSLAMIYVEMLTGALPDEPIAASLDELALAGRLSKRDRSVLLRALDEDPGNRFENCTDFLEALEAKEAHKSALVDFEAEQFAEVIRTEKRSFSSLADLATGENQADLDALIAELSGTAEQGDESDQPTVVASRLGDDKLHACWKVELPSGEARKRLDRVRQHYFARVVTDDPGTFEFHLELPQSIWQQWMGRHPGLRLTARIERVHPLQHTPVQVDVTITAEGCHRTNAGQILEETGKQMLEAIGDALAVGAHNRASRRFLWPDPVWVRPVLGDGTLGPGIECRGKDISSTGVGFYLPNELESALVVVELRRETTGKAITVPARIVRAVPCADGWYDVGAIFNRRSRYLQKENEASRDDAREAS